MKNASAVLAALVLSLSVRAASAYDLIQLLEPLASPEAPKPVAAVVSGEGTLFVLDAKKGSVLAFDPTGRLLASAGRPGADAAGFSDPRGLALGPDGDLFVADTGNHRVRVLGADLKSKGVFGVKGSSPGELDSPASVAVGRDGRVYVADTGNDRVQVFTKDGVFLFGFGKAGKEPGQFSGPTRVAVDASDHIYVLDAGNDRVQKFDPRTRLVKEYSLLGQDFSVDEYGFLYMLDGKKGKVNELGPDGFVLGGFGTSGAGPGQFRKPQGISIAPDGTIVVADTGNARVLRVQVANKLKKSKVAGNLETKLLVSGPVMTAPVSATALAPLGEALYAYLPKSGQFAAFGRDGRELFRFGSKTAKSVSSTSRAGGIAASPAHGLYVADAEGDKMQAFDSSGNFKANFAQTKGMFESKKREGAVDSPSGVAVNDKGTVYVADTANRRVEAFSPEGTFLFAFGPKVGAHELREPVSVVWDEAGFIYLLDKGLKKVFKCEPSGGFLLAFGEEGSEVGRFLDPVSLAYDGKNYLYVLDKGALRVSVFDRQGTWVTNFFAGGKDERSLAEPSALAVQGDRLVVSDPGRQKISAFTLHPRLAPPPAVSTKTVEGQVYLKWEETGDPWLRHYRVYRASQAAGPFLELPPSRSAGVKDAEVEPYRRYYYRVAAEAETGDLGPATAPIEVFVPGAFNRAPVEISTVTVGNLFSANYKWYLRNPLGTVSVVNNVNVPFQSVKVSFHLKDYMDFATEKVIDSIEPRQKVEVPLTATLNNRILEVTEDTPIQAELTLTYYERGRPQSVSRALPLKVYSRNAVTWQDPGRIANFVTPKDPPVLDFAREVLRQPPAGPPGAEHLDESLVSAIHLWNALGAVGVRFLPSPNNPFEKVFEDPAFPVDYIQFPRETLKRRSGECDDLVALIASLLEGATIRTAVLDYPGHLALMFDTGSDDPRKVGLPAERLVEHEGSLWIPLETTMVGSPFSDAARKALFSYREMHAQGRVKVIDPRQAWEDYEPATLPTSDQKLDAADPAELAKRFAAAAEGYSKERYDFLSGEYARRLEKDPSDAASKNGLGLLYAQYGKHAEARKEFEAVLSRDPGDPAALNNLGSLAYLGGRYEEALDRYQKAAERDPKDPGIWMNAARAALKAGRKEAARDASAKAVALDKELQSDADSLLK